MDATNPVSLRKAAILIRNLDAEAAAALLMRLDPAEARLLRIAIRELGEVAPEDVADLLIELESRSQVPLVPQATRAAAVETPINESPVSATEAPTIPPPAAAATQVLADRAMPFGWLHDEDIPLVADRLQNEQPVTIAAVLPNLRPEQATRLMSLLPAALRMATVERLLSARDLDGESLKLVEASLEKWAGDHRLQRTRRDERLKQLAAMLAFADNDLRSDLLRQIGERDRAAVEAAIDPQAGTERTGLDRNPSLKSTRKNRQAESLERLKAAAESNLPSVSAERVERPPADPRPIARSALPATTAQLQQLDADELAAVLRRCGTERFSLGLFDAPASVLAHVQKLVGDSAFRSLRERMHALRNVRLAELEHAAQRLAETAAEVLSQRGQRRRSPQLELQSI